VDVDPTRIAAALAALPRRIRREARTIVGAWPAAARRFRTGEFPTEATELCIEAFPRSGNTFTVIAFLQAQPRLVSVAHHVHAAGAVIEGVRLGTPTLVLIRPPEGSVLSYVTRWPELTPAHALRGYVRFYEPLLPHRPGFSVARFEEVTQDPGIAIRRVNERFGTSFAPFVPTEAHLRAVHEEMERWDRNTEREEGRPIALARGLPTAEKEARKAELRERYLAAPLARLRARAESLHRALTADLS
jgi:hypothetical protein